VAKRFRGEGSYKLDDKGRVLLPASLREVLEGVDGRIPTDPRPELIIVYGDDGQRHLEVYTGETMDTLADKIEALDEGPVKWAAEDRYFGQTLRVEVDGSGRILLAARLREKLGAPDEVYLIGRGRKFEIWRKEDFEADRAEKRASGAISVPEGGALLQAIDEQLKAQQAPRRGDGT